MTTTFFFDLFGVLLGADKSTLLHFIAKRTGNTYEKAEHIFSRYFTDFEQSRISFSGFFHVTMSRGSRRHCRWNTQ